MKVGILDCAHPTPEAGSGLAASWLRWQAPRHGLEVTHPSEADVVLCTHVSPMGWAEVPKALRGAGIEPDATRRGRSPWVFAGGGISSAPSCLDGVVDTVCIGEGAEFLLSLATSGAEACTGLPCSWVAGESRAVVPSEEFPWDVPPTRFEDNIIRLYASRGCPRRCAFCQTGWASTYRETPHQRRLIAQHAAFRRAKDRVALVTNDALDLSFYGPWAVTEHFSTTYAGLRRLLDSGQELVGKVKVVRIGVEGVAEDLRKWCGKPVDNAGLVRATAYLANNGVDVRWFMIAGLPGETAEHWREFRDTLSKLKRMLSSKAVLVTFTAWTPSSASPLAYATISEAYWEHFQELKRWFLCQGGNSARIKLGTPQAPKSRLMSARAALGLSEMQLRSGGAQSPMERIQWPHKPHQAPFWKSYARRAGILV